ncbi:MAG: hypothetical protein FJX75_20890 [Armatimonadetes bacterium]|nr:hypothetical protein [Armatimonadota bacterium]
MCASLGLGILLLAGHAPSQALLTAYRADTAPVLDGDLADACWQAASVASPFLSNAGAGLVEEQTQVRVCWDEANLYVGVEAFESLLEPKLNMLHLVKAEQTGRDAPVWNEDSVEVFLQPPGHAYYQFAANSGTGTYEAESYNAAWNCDWRCVAKRTERSYILELAIPLAALGGQPTGEWRANFTRNRSFAKELSTWSGLQGNFHQPEAFGTLRFAPTGPALGPVKLILGDDKLTAFATLAGAADEATRLELRVTSGDEVTSGQANGPGRKQIEVALPKAALASGQARAAYRVVQGNEDVLGSAGIPQSIAAAVVTMRLGTKDAQAEVFLNGLAVAPGDAVDLRLQRGLNVVALEAKATGLQPSIRPALEHDARGVSPRWVVRTDQPPDDWRTAAPQAGWSPAVAQGGGLWAEAGAQEARFAAALFVGERGPQLFPKMDTFYVPRGSRQLLRCYVHAPQDVPSEAYRMVVEAPASLKFVAFDPLGGGAITEVKQGAASPVGGVEMTRHEIAYDALPGQGFELAMRWGDKTEHTMTYEPTIAGGGTFDWRHMSMVVKPPPGAVSAHPLIIKWQNRGIVGTFWVDNVVFRAKDSDQNLLKMGSFDEPEWGNTWYLTPEGPDGSKCVKFVAKPEDVDRQQAAWVDREGVVPVEQGKEYVIELDLKCEKLGSPHAKPICGLLFEAPADLAEGELPLFTWFESLEGTVCELPTRSRVQVLPPLKNVRPKAARICPCYYGSQFSNPVVAEAFADNCYASGITWTYGGYGNDVVPFLKDRGHRVFWSIGWEPFGVPASLQDFAAEHPEFLAVDFKGQPIRHTLCPTWVLTEGTQVIEALEKWFLDTVNGTPYDGANWDLEQPVVDPPTFCTCARCLEAFRAFAKLPADVALNAETILASHREQWTTFRCTQNAEMAGKLKAIFAKAARPVEFSMYSGYQSTNTREHYGVDWSLLAPHLDLAIAGYGGDRGAIQATVQALNGVPFMGGEMWYLSDRNDERPMPRMETWRNRILRQFAESGGNGCLIWWLPPMDGGAFYATSEAAEIIARHEDFFRLKQRCDEKVQVTGLDPRNWLAFEKDGQVLVMLLNFRAEPLAPTVRVGEHEETAEIEPYGVRVLVR